LYLDANPQLLPAGAKVLHVAPEPILRQRFHVADGAYVDTDLDQKDVSINMDITDNPFRDGYFDLVVCSHVLEHVPDDRKAIRESLRVLAPTRFALFQVPVYDVPDGITQEDPQIVEPEKRLQEFGQDDHVRKYGRDVIQRFIDEGCSVEVVTPEDFSQGMRQRYGLESGDGVRREDIYLCGKC
jgi:SAM-dependent methyltransferase